MLPKSIIFFKKCVGFVQALKEKTELQTQLAALNMKLQAQVEQSQSSLKKQDSLNSEVASLKQSCWDLERAMAELQGALEAKNASLAASDHDLHVAEEQYQRLMGKVEDMQRSVLSKDSTGEKTSFARWDIGWSSFTSEPLAETESSG